MNATRLLALGLHDVRLQARYGIYAAYGFVIALYAAILVGVGAAMPAWGPAAIIFSDPAGLGYIFLGGLMMLEKSERVRAALSVTPVAPAEYFVAKAATLTLVALVACTVLALTMHGGADLPLLLGTVALTSVQYVGIGVPIALRFRTVTSYIIGAGGLLTPLIAPGFLALLDPMPGWLTAIPAVSQFRLMLVATHAASATPLEIALMLFVCLLAAAGASALAIHALRREFGR